MSVPHTYRVLDAERKEIRLFRLRTYTLATDGNEAQISGSIEYTSLLDPPAYTALSYVWGEPVLKSGIQLDGETYLPITENLSIALAHIADLTQITENRSRRPSVEIQDDVNDLTHKIGTLPIDEELHNRETAETGKKHDTLLWIDAICIDQSNDIEKSWQVAQMGDVYASAEQTIVFLGPQSEHSDEAVDFFEETATIALEYKLFADRYRTSARFQESIRSHLNHDFDLADRDSLDRFLQSLIMRGRHDPSKASVLDLASSIMGRAWWYRTWPLQELVMSRSPLLLCGRKTLQRSCFYATFKLLNMFRRALPTSPRGSIINFAKSQLDQCQYQGLLWSAAIDMACMLEANDTITVSLADVMTFVQVSSKALCASDPRDIIFGLLGLVRQWNPDQTQVKPDYSIDYVQVYVTTSVSLMECGWSYNLRYAVTPKTLLGLPSWVPDRSARDEARITIKVSPEFTNFAISYSLDTSGMHILTTPGQIFGKIKRLGPSYSAQADSNEVAAMDSLCWMEDADLMLTYFTELVQHIAKHFRDEIECRIQLNVLSYAIQTQMGSTKEIHPASHFLAVDEEFDQETHLTNLAYDPDLSFGSTSNRATITRDVMVDLPALETSPLFTISREAKWQAFQQSSPQPLSWRDEPVTTGILSDELRNVFTALYVFFLALCRYEPFVAGNSCVGVAKKWIQDGDVLVKFDMDPLGFYVLRKVKEDLWELISAATVPILSKREKAIERERMDFRLC